MKLLVDSRAKEGKDKKLRLEAVFSKMNVKARWYKGKEELFLGKKFHMQSEGDLHVLVINNPTVEDSGRYKIECMGISSNCMVTVDGKSNHIYFSFIFGRGWYFFNRNSISSFSL